MAACEVQPLAAYGIALVLYLHLEVVAAKEPLAHGYDAQQLGRHQAVVGVIGTAAPEAPSLTAPAPELAA